MSQEGDPELVRLAQLLSKRIQKEERFIHELHEFRGVRLKSVFIKSGVADHYIMHAGGRRETQFNIGYEGEGPDSTMRYGLAFSLEPSRTLVDPLQEFRDRIKVFNKLVAQSPKRLLGYKLSVDLPDGTSKRGLRPREIPENWIVPGAFIFVGKYKKKAFAQYDDDDVSDIIDVLDDLYPIYKQIESEVKDAALIESRISRICWNEEGWVRPSGPNGKSKNEEAFEHKYGYGHEEWLFNYDFLHEGYQYAYLQSVQQSIQVYEGGTFDIGLFSVRELDRRTKQVFWIAKIRNVYVLTKEERSEVRQRTKDNGQLEERIKDLEELGLTRAKIRESFERYGVLNIRFRPEDVVLAPEVQESSELTEIPSYHYTLMRSPLPGFERSEGERKIALSGKTWIEGGGARRRPVNLEEKECSDFHRTIQNDLSNFLRKECPGDVVDLETKTGLGTKIDCYRQTGKVEIFYEVKTYSSAKRCIRESLGQLLEYAAYPDGGGKYGLVIVGHAHPTSSDKSYLKCLNQDMGINIQYLLYRPEDGSFVQVE